MLYSSLTRFAEQLPTKVAVREPVRSITYGELNALALRVARNLRACGVEPGTIVAVCLHGDVEFAVLKYAAARLGALVAALTPQLGAELLMNQSAELRPDFVVADELPESARRGTAAQPGVTLISRTATAGASTTLAELFNSDAHLTVPLPDRRWSSEAFLVHVTAEEPRGARCVVQSHEQYLQHLHDWANACGANEKDRTFCAVPLSDATIAPTAWTALLTGQTLVLNSAAARAPHAALTSLRDEKISVFGASTDSLEALLALPATTDFGLPDLRLVLCGDRPLSRQQQARLEQRLGRKLEGR